MTGWANPMVKTLATILLSTRADFRVFIVVLPRNNATIPDPRGQKALPDS